MMKSLTKLRRAIKKRDSLVRIHSDIQAILISGKLVTRRDIDKHQKWEHTSKLRIDRENQIIKDSMDDLGYKRESDIPPEPVDPNATLVKVAKSAKARAKKMPTVNNTPLCSVAGCFRQVTGKIKSMKCSLHQKDRAFDPGSQVVKDWAGTAGKPVPAFKAEPNGLMKWLTV